MSADDPKKNIRKKVRRALRAGMKPLEIARQWNVPLLLIAEIAVWEATFRHSGGTGFDL